MHDARKYETHVRRFMSERVRRDYGRLLYAWNVTAVLHGCLDHTCLCDDDVTATWSTGTGTQQPSVIVYKSVQVVVSRVVADCQLLILCLSHKMFCMVEFDII